MAEFIKIHLNIIIKDTSKIVTEEKITKANKPGVVKAGNKILTNGTPKKKGNNKS